MRPSFPPTAEVPLFLSHLGWLLLILVAFAVLLTSCADTSLSDPGDSGVTQPDGDEPDGYAGQTIYLYPTTKAAGPPIAKLLYDFDALRLGGTYYVALVFSTDFVDNTYGVNSSTGYRKDKGHKFDELVGSDHAIIGFEDADGNLLYEVKLDYITEDDTTTSGYSSGGIWDGDGKMELGSEDVVLHARSSLDHNLNELGCVYLEDSPVAPDCPDWERRVIYEVWLDASMFGPAGFGRPVLDHVHASPSRTDDTVPVGPGEPPEGCLPEIDGPACEDPPAGEPVPEPPVTVE